MKTRNLKIDDVNRIATKPDGTKISVIDSEFTFLITPNKDDIKNGIPGDHANCMYCLACKRMHGSELVWVARTTAYVELPDLDGNPQLHRFILSSPARFKMKDFDAKKYVAKHAVVFAAPKGNQTLEAISKNWKAWKKKVDAGYKPKKKAHILGQKKDHSIRPLDLTLRDPATGMFQFKVPSNYPKTKANRDQ